MLKVLHLTAHLGGGVGKALSGLAAQASASLSSVRHDFVCFEKLKKSQFADLIRACGSKVIVRPDNDQLDALIRAADIVQLEWWNHPATMKYLCSRMLPAMRLIIWSHVSGLHTPIIPQGLILASHRFLFTSACSFQSQESINLPAVVKNRLDFVHSSGGFSGLPTFRRRFDEPLAVGYFGSLNFSKLNPSFVDYLAAVGIPGFTVRMIGDAVNRDVLNHQCERCRKPDMLDFRGFTNNVGDELAAINVLAYLLNPTHYGTTENALLEAMAMGIVPVVLNNPAECQIVENRITGLIVNSPVEFAEAIQWLSSNPHERDKLGEQAAKSVREQYSIEKVESSLNSHYMDVFAMSKKEIAFREVFGNEPAKWFLSCQEDKSIFAAGGNILLDGNLPFLDGLIEKKKGTVFHFHRYFPDDLELKLWAKNLSLLR